MDHGVAFHELAEQVRRLHRALQQLQAECRCLPIGPFAETEWYEILERKLLPQLGTEAWLVVAVTGGTNIGKSVIFNHLAGFRASASSPLASGTKHPVCLMPSGFSERNDLAAMFPGFQVRPWSTSEDSLVECAEDVLFWRTSAEVPSNLLLLDTPDVDSDAPVNWRRADAVRQAADVLVAVLTQQKYNDAAVKQFFRKAATEDKAVILVFNQCELPDDETYWPIWCQTFCEETGLHPEWIFLAPNDRKSAENLSLPFYERRWNTGESGGEDLDQSPAKDTGVSFQETLSRLKFAEIKLRTLRGALQQVLGPEGVESTLSAIRLSSADYRSAADLLTAQRLAEVDHWPTAPTNLLVRSIQEWWARQRSGWSASVHGFYNAVGQWLMTPVHSVNTWISGPTEPPWDSYRRQEWNAILRTVEKVYERLEWLTQLGHDLLKKSLEEALSGTSRSALLDRLQHDHAQCDFAAELEQLVSQELEVFRRESPNSFQFFQRLDVAAAAARPGLSVVLGLSGIGLPLGEAATHLASHALMQSALHVVGDVAGGTMAAAVGETAITQTAASGIGYLQARFHRLQAAFTAGRVAWLATRLEHDLLGPTTRQLSEAVGVPSSKAFLEVDSLLPELKRALSQFS